MIENLLLIKMKISIIFILTTIFCSAYSVINDGPFICEDSDRNLKKMCPMICKVPRLIRIDKKGNAALACSECAICTEDTFAYYLTHDCTTPCGNPSIPVCAYIENGDKGGLKQYKNGCTACKNKKLQSYFHGYCP